MNLKLVSVNIEGQKHLGTVREFLQRENPDVVCLMEACEEDLDFLLSEYPYRVFGPNFRLPESGVAGVVIASKQTIANGQVFYPDGGGSEIPMEGLGSHRPVLVMGETSGLHVAAIHFTWTPNMSETEQQKQDLERLFAHLGETELTMVGDFNIPRGNATYQRLAGKYQDNIPPEVTTTIDWELHRAKREGKPQFEAMVDYVWSTPKYTVENVRVVSGVSDHCGLVCQIDKI